MKFVLAKMTGNHYNSPCCREHAGIAQSVAQLIRNQ